LELLVFIYILFSFCFFVMHKTNTKKKKKKSNAKDKSSPVKEYIKIKSQFINYLPVVKDNYNYLPFFFSRTVTKPPIVWRKIKLSYFPL
jgi:predicted membrane protein